MRHKIVMVTGGARSGKSTFAEKYAAACSEKVAYIATAQIYDDEMKSRIGLHKQRRPDTWQTFEAPYGAEKVICQAAEYSKIILFDCLTMYTSNLLLSEDAPSTPELRFQYILEKLTMLLTNAINSDTTTIFVTNEVGLGIVPENALAREYRDIAGKVNQVVAEYADEVYLVVSGLAVELKRIAVTIDKEGSHA